MTDALDCNSRPIVQRDKQNGLLLSQQYILVCCCLNRASQHILPAAIGCVILVCVLAQRGQSPSATYLLASAAAAGSDCIQNALFSGSPAPNRWSYFTLSSPAGRRSMARTANSRSWRAFARLELSAM